MNEKSMLAAADTLKALRDEKSDLQAKLKDVQERIDSVEAELIQLMTDEECTGFDRNGSRFSLVIREFPGAWLRPSVHHQHHDAWRYGQRAQGQQR